MENLPSIFKQLKKILKQYEPPFVVRGNDDTQYHLWSMKNVVIAGRKRTETYFAGLIIQSNYVGFYYMPVYASPELKKVFKKELLSMLKGKSCFHIKKLDKALVKQIRDALEIGYKHYKKRGWV